LGLLGSRLQVSFKFTSFLVIAISIMMVVLALQMLGVKTFRKFQFTLPKSITRYIADERKFKGKYMPFIMGALTFFLPCGFTITVQSLALLSGSFLQGGLIMLSFVLGTTPALILIGFSSVKFSEKPHLAYKFSRIAGILVLFFALFNINSQLNVLGFSSFSDLKFNSVKEVSVSNNEEGLPPIINGKQVIKMEASAYGYQPDYFKVRVGVPVRWEITDTGTSGCTNAIISKGLFSDAINLTPGQTSIKEFTPTKTGKYKFSCWMGMVSGIIEVVDSKSSSNSVSAATINFSNSNDVIPSGVRSCGCCGR
jgi:sulfite exporter TauE/SafE